MSVMNFIYSLWISVDEKFYSLLRQSGVIASMVNVKLQVRA